MLIGNVGAAIVGALVGALVVLAVDGLTRTPSRGPARSTPSVTFDAPEGNDVPPATLKATTALLAWSPGGLGPGTLAAVEALPGVRGASLVRAGLDWLTRTALPDGTVVDDPRSGYRIPVEVAVVDPVSYVRSVPLSERGLIASLRPGQALLAETSAELRGATSGLQLELSDRTLTVSGVISDVAASGYEIVTAGSVPSTWERVDEFLLVEINRKANRRSIERTISQRLAPQQVLRVRGQGETPYLRYGDAVLPQMLIKDAFGEFAARPLATGFIEIEPRWHSRNIAAEKVPILGTVTCHRALFPQLRLALRDALSSGLAYAIDPGDFGGCYSPRFIDRDPTGRLSHHSWGIAVDLNVAENLQGTRPDQDSRLVKVMESWGFTWGGRWLIPDGMHFEWTRFP